MTDDHLHLDLLDQSGQYKLLTALTLNVSTTREECRKVSHKSTPAQDYPHPDRGIFTLLMRCYILKLCFAFYR